MCHEPARKRRNGRRRNGDESLARDNDILWKTFDVVQQTTITTHLHRPESRRNTGFCVRSSVKTYPCMAALRGSVLPDVVLPADPAMRQVPEKQRQKRKTRPGGQPDGSSHMGAWGGWALAPNTASMGRDNRSHIHWSQQGRRTFKGPRDFFEFFARGFGRNLGFGRIYCAAARLASPAVDFPRPWRLPAGSGPVSGEPVVGPGHLQRRAHGETTGRPAPPARR